jgi:hypothetical protein
MRCRNAADFILVFSPISRVKELNSTHVVDGSIIVLNDIIIDVDIHLLFVRTNSKKTNEFQKKDFFSGARARMQGVIELLLLLFAVFTVAFNIYLSWNMWMREGNIAIPLILLAFSFAYCVDYSMMQVDQRFPPKDRIRVA